MGKSTANDKSVVKKKNITGPIKTIINKKEFSSHKKSFFPVIDSKTKMIILGSLPGDESLRLQQYYANPRNQFWNILEAVLKSQAPINYIDKLKWLSKKGIGLWDVCHSAQRKGSLDQNINNVIPNDIPALLKEEAGVHE